MKSLRLAFAMFMGLAVASTGLKAEEKELKVGDAAPKFEAVDDAGKKFSSDSLKGKIAVVYFYPIATTGGCTKQACGYRDQLGKLKEKGVEVVGVSGDSPVGLKLFKGLHDLNFTLLSDEKGDVAKAFGVPTSGKGRTMKVKNKEGSDVEWQVGTVTQRYTFVMDKEGKIVSKEKVGDAGGDAKKVSEIVEKLK